MSNDSEVQHSRRRPVRSFVLRGGRLTRSQSHAIESLYPVFGVPIDDSPIDSEQLFGRKAPLWAEIGFGNGESLVSLAQTHPQLNVLGIEVHRPGVGHCLHCLQERKVENLRVLQQDAVVVLRDRLPEAALARLLVLFPDPWHKKRHHKRRLINPEFAELAARVIEPGGVWHLATDWEPYAVWMREVIDNCPRFRNRRRAGDTAEPASYRVLTRFESRGLRLGHRVYDIEFERC